MQTCFPLIAAVLAASLTGCYNDPQISDRHPGSSKRNQHAGPAVGPGTTQGGSTAGPQPVARKHAPKHGSPEPAYDVAPKPKTELSHQKH